MPGLLGLVRRFNLRHFAERKFRTLLTMSGVAAGVALVFSITLINSTLIATVRYTVRAVGGAAEIEVAAAARAGLPMDDVGEVAGVQGVELAVPLLRVTVPVSGEDATRRTLVLGVTPDFRTLFPPGSRGEAGLTFEGGFGPLGGGLVLSKDSAEAIGAEIGDEVAVQTRGGRMPIELTGTVAGNALRLVNGGYLGAMVLPVAQAVFDRADRIDSIYVVTEPDASLETIEAQIEERLAGAAIVGPPGERGRAFDETLASFASLTSLAGIVALFVAAFVVYITLSMSLTERRREISMALAFGATRRQVLGAFVLEAVALGSMASVVGIAAGFGLARVLVRSAAAGWEVVLPVSAVGLVELAPLHLALAFGGGVAVAVVGALVPLRRVMSVAPIECLRPGGPQEEGGARPQRRRASAVVGVGLLALAAFGAANADLSLGASVAVLLPGMAGILLLLPAAVSVALLVLRPILTRSAGPVGRLAADALERNPRRTTLTVGALLMTSALVVAVGGAMGSMTAEVDERSRFWFFAPLYVNATTNTGFGSEQPLDASLEPAFSHVDGVDAAYPARYGMVTLGSSPPGPRRPTVIYAVSVNRAEREGIMERQPPDTSAYWETTLGGLGPDEVVVSTLTASNAGVGVGGSLLLPTPHGERAFRVAGLFEDLAPFPSLYMDYVTYARLWDDETADRFAVFVSADAEVSDVRRDLVGVVERLGIPARVETRAETQAQLVKLVEGTFAIARGVQLAALIIAALTIANTMFIAVVERRWEFGLQRALGMSRAQLGRSVALEAASIGVIGGIGAVLVGTAQGMLMTALLSSQYSWGLSFHPDWSLVALAGAGGVVIASAAGVHPRRVAVRTPIIDSLRYE